MIDCPGIPMHFSNVKVPPPSPTQGSDSRQFLAYNPRQNVLEHFNKTGLLCLNQFQNDPPPPKQFCLMGKLILHGKLNVTGGGGFPWTLRKCEGVPKFMTKIGALIQPQDTAPWGPRSRPQSMTQSLI